MAKTLLYRLFGIGKLPDHVLAEHRTEGIRLTDEGIRGTVTYKNFRGGGRYSNWKRQWFGAAIILTKNRFVAYRLRHPIIDVALDDPRLKQVELSFEEPETIAFCFDASLFQPDWKGRIEYRFRTPIAREILESLQDSGG